MISGVNELAGWASLVGIVSALLGAVGAGVGVYVSMRLEIARLEASYRLAVHEVRAELVKLAAVVDIRLGSLEGDMRAVSEFAKAQSKRGDL